MKHANVISGVVLAMFGLVMLLVVIPWQIEAGPQGMVSPRLVPNMMMIVVTALAVPLVLTNLSGERYDPEADAVPPVSHAEFIALLKFGTVFGLALGLYHWVSPLAAGASLTMGALVVLGERRLSVILLMPAALMLALWLLFYKVLGTAIV